MRQRQIEVLEKALNKYGAKNELMICGEECAELIQAISKIQRATEEEHSKKRDDLIQEIADVLICVEYLKMIEEIQPLEVDFAIEQKIARLSYRVEGM